MRTKTLQYLLFGVTLAFGLHAELLPNPSGEAASGTSVGGNWFGLSVQDSGFLLTNASASAQSASDHAADQEGFAAYFTGTPRSSESSTQLSASGSFSSAVGAANVTGSVATLMAIATTTDIITETYTSTGFNARPAAMSPTSSPAQMTSYSNSFANAWQLSSQSSYNQQPTSQSTSDAEYAARLVYGGSYAPQNNNAQSYSPATGYNFNQYSNVYSWNAPVNNPAPQSNAVDDSMFFALMNAGMSIWAPSYYVPATVNFSGQQLVSAPIPPPQFVSNVTGVPEPSTWAMILSAAAAIAARRRFTRS